MRRVLVILTACFLVRLPIWAGDEPFPDGSRPSQLGGLMYFRQGNQTNLSFGGAFLPRKVKVITRTPEGPVVTRFTLPSLLQTPNAPSVPFAVSVGCSVQVEIPDRFAQLYIEDTLVRSHGSSRVLQSPPIPVGKPCPVRVRAVFMIGDKVMIEDKQVLLRAGETMNVNFDGSQAIAVSLPGVLRAGSVSDGHSIRR